MHSSPWIASDDIPAFLPLDADADTDVVVVGAGISGLTTALLLQRSGHRVVVIDMHGVATGTTGHTTGKVTSQHGLTYARLVDEHGEETARAVRRGQRGRRGDGRRAGWIHGRRLRPHPRLGVRLHHRPRPGRRCRTGGVDGCRPRTAGVLADPAEVDVEPALAAVRFDAQLHLDAYRYCRALAAAIVDGGGSVHEQTRATRTRELSDHVVVETDGGSVRAEHAVIATLLPFLDSGGFFARSRASRAYGLAIRVRGAVPSGMFITAERPTRSVRPWPAGGPGGLIVVGEEHETGSDSDTVGHYHRLEDWAADDVRRAVRRAHLVGAGLHIGRSHPVRRPLTIAPADLGGDRLSQVGAEQRHGGGDGVGGVDRRRGASLAGAVRHAVASAVAGPSPGRRETTSRSAGTSSATGSVVSTPARSTRWRQARAPSSVTVARCSAPTVTRPVPTTA